MYAGDFPCRQSLGFESCAAKSLVPLSRAYVKVTLAIGLISVTNLPYTLKTGTPIEDGDPILKLLQGDTISSRVHRAQKEAY